MKLCLKTTLFFLLSLPTLAQDILDNQGIVSLLSSKMSQDIVITKISSSKCKFDLSVNGLVELKNGRVPDKIVKAMFTASPPTEIMTNEDVIKLSNSKIGSGIFKEKLMRTPHKFDVSSEALVRLKEAKVPDAVIKDMILSPYQGANAVATTRPNDVPNENSNVAPTVVSQYGRNPNERELRNNARDLEREREKEERDRERAARDKEREEKNRERDAKREKENEARKLEREERNREREERYGSRDRRESSSRSSERSRPVRIRVVNDLYDVRGLKKMNEVTASASKPDGRQYSLKNDALDKLKREAEEKGATHILILSETFTLTPVNTVKLVGVLYQ
jgi:flagellar biosynthesis GTPase FlhF